MKTDATARCLLLGSPRRRWLVAAAIACLGVSGASLHRLAAQGNITEERGTLPDGTEYLMRVPADWNGTVIRDLDYASGASAPRWAHLLDKKYALAGTGPHRLRLN